MSLADTACRQSMLASQYTSYLLCRYIMPDDPTSVLAIVLKILLDRLLFTPVNMGALFLFNGFLEGQSLRRILLTARQR